MGSTRLHGPAPGIPLWPYKQVLLSPFHVGEPRAMSEQKWFPVSQRPLEAKLGL
jgi:hypothetical protein